MPTQSRNELGKLISTHGISPVFLQRAAIVAVLSLLFFLAGLMFFYIQKSIGYFIVATGFLVVYIFTMIGWVMQRKNVVSVYENGITYRKFASTWENLTSVSASNESGINLVTSSGDSVTIGKSVADLDKLAIAIRARLP